MPITPVSFLQPISELQGKEYVYTLLSDPRACKAVRAACHWYAQACRVAGYGSNPPDPTLRQSFVYTVLMNITVMVSTVTLVIETFFIKTPITMTWYVQLLGTYFEVASESRLRMRDLIGCAFVQVHI